MAQKRQRIDFEKSLAELEALLDKLESDELPLEESLTLFEKGVKLTRNCQEALATAEQRVQLLLEDQEVPVAMPPATDAED